MTDTSRRAGGYYWLASYPKSGNTWARLIIENLLAGDAGPADINNLAAADSATGWYWGERSLGFSMANLTQSERLSLRPELHSWAGKRPGTHYYKTHEGNFATPAGEPLFDPQAALGVVYLVRNPLDVAASYSHHRGRDIDDTIAKMADPAAELANSGSGQSPQPRQWMGSWSHNVGSWLDAAGWNRLVLRFEDLQAQPFQEAGRLSAFLKLSTGTENLRRAVEHSRFEVLAAQEQARGFDEKPSKAENFFRKGESGGWRSELSEAQIERIVSDHGPVMRRLGYLDAGGAPV
ncbi:MAG TPA: sulfotransferase [Spongiibacteraceae bacterium]|nr:sulfotransferase [Spongiibacteraceae bacterium]HCS28285.1 sulfotransferase [Spongiibacteraceae bacterium]